MAFSTGDVVPFTQARAKLSELADQPKAGAEKIITKDGASYVALIDADRLDYYHRLERERIHLLLHRRSESRLGRYRSRPDCRGRRLHRADLTAPGRGPIRPCRQGRRQA